MSLLALSVGVGSELDPPDFIGFTHLIEHLLFTGSESYKENHYIEKIINKYHGQENGVTKAFATSYFYKLEAEGLEEFLPVLVDAVKNPLFSMENVLKEVNNVNSEISMRMTYNKNLAYYKIIKAIGNKQSRIFSDGFANIDSKSINIEQLRARIIEFHKKYYSANIMTLAIITERDFSDVRAVVESNFSKIPNKKVSRPFFNDTSSLVEPFDNKVFGNVYYIKGFTDPTKFSMVFQIPSELAKSQFHPLEFFSFIMNYFSENSLKQTLIKENLISSFSDSVVLQDYVDSLYIITFQLTPKTNGKISKIIKHFFRFVQLIKILANKAEIYKTFSKTSKYGFLFNVKNDFINFSNIESDFFDRCLDFSEKMQDFEPDVMFTLNNVLFQYNQDEFDSMMEHLNPQQVFYMIESTEFKESVIKMQDTGVSVKTTSNSKNTPHSRSLENIRVDYEAISDMSNDHEQLKMSKRSRKLEEITSMTSELVLNNTPPVQDRKLVRQRNKSTKSKSDENLEQFMEDYFDDIIDIKLKYAFDFDNGRQYEIQKIKSHDLALFAETINESTTSYDVVESFDTSHLDNYPIVTSCEAPVSLRDDSSTNKNILSTTKSEQKSSKSLDTRSVFDAVFAEGKFKSNSEGRFSAMRDLLEYKLCLVNEFVDDGKNFEAKKVFDSNTLTVYHNLYRKTFQPKTVVSVSIESKYAADIATKADTETRMRLDFSMELFCHYITSHVELEYHGEFMKGGEFKCSVPDFRILLEFSAISDQLESFINTIIASFSLFTQKKIYKKYILDNYKQKMKNSLSQFNSITSLKASLFYLNIIMDKNYIDNSSPEKLNKIKQIIDDIDADTLKDLAINLFSEKKLIVLMVGNIDQDTAISLGKHIEYFLAFEGKTSTEQIAINPMENRNFAIENFAKNLAPNTHCVVRMENRDPKETNSAYLTYFGISRLTRRLRFLTLVLIRYLRTTTYDKLRNEDNLGYVAQAGIRSFYSVI